MDPNGLGLNPSPATYQLCDLEQVTYLSVLLFPHMLKETNKVPISQGCHED